MKYSLFILFVFIFSGLAAASLTGVVYVENTKTPLDNCEVLVMQEGKLISAGTTSFNGVFNLNLKKNADYVVEIVKSGFEKKRLEIHADQAFFDENKLYKVYLTNLDLQPKFDKMQDGVVKPIPNPDIMEDIGSLSSLPEGYKIIEAKPLKFDENKSTGFNVNLNSSVQKTNVNVEVLKEAFNKDNLMETINSDKEKFPSSYYAEGSIYYGSGKVLLTENVKEILQSIAKKLMNEPMTALKIMAYADAQREVDLGSYIAKLRIEEVTKYLMSLGVKFEQLEVNVIGNSFFENGCYKDVDCSEFEHQQNRKVDLVLVN